MSETLNVSNYTKTFHDKLSVKQVNSFKKTTSDCFKTKYQYFEKRNELQSTTTTSGATHMFTIPKSDGYIGDIRLEIIGTNAGTYDHGLALAYCAIEQVDFEMSGRNILTYTGMQLWEVLNVVNKRKEDRDIIYELAGNSTDVSATPVYALLIGPGSNGIISDDFDNRKPKFPIGFSNTDMTIKIKLRTNATIDANSAFALASVKLLYTSYNVKDDVIYNDPKGSSKSIYYTWNYIKPIGETQTVTWSSTVKLSANIENCITEGNLFAMIVSMHDLTTDGAALDYGLTESIDKLECFIKSDQPLYSHKTASEGRLTCLMKWGISNITINDDTQGASYIYPISLVGGDPRMNITNIGSKCINLNTTKPKLEITNTTVVNTGNSYHLRVTALYQCLYTMYSDKTTEALII